MRRLLPLIAFGVLALLLLAGVLASRDPDRDAIASPLIGKPAPAFALPVYGEPQTVMRESELRGKPYLLNVWGSWCPTCVDEHPVITRVAKSGRVRVIGFNYKDDPDAAAQWLQRFGNPYERIVVDADGLSALDWGIYAAPETFLVDANGVVRWKHVGALDDEIVANELWPALEAMP